MVSSGVRVLYRAVEDLLMNWDSFGSLKSPEDMKWEQACGEEGLGTDEDLEWEHCGRGRLWWLRIAY